MLATTVLALALTAVQDARVVGNQAPAPPRTQPVAAASAPPIEVLLTNVPGAARAAVPGVPGAVFDPGSGTQHFDRVYGHPTGGWVLTAKADLAAGEDECLIANGQLVIREGDVAPWTGGAADCGTLDTRCAIDANGRVAFATNVSGSTNDDYVVVASGSQWAVAAREGDPVPGLAGAVFDDAIESPVLVDDGRVGLVADGIDGAVMPSEDEVLLLGSTVLLQAGVSVPGGQTQSTPRPIEGFDLSDFFVSSDGAHWAVQGDLDGPVAFDDVVVVDGSVVLLEGYPVPGSSFTNPIDRDGIYAISMDAAGHWYAAGVNDQTNDDWLVRDGAVLARTGQPIVPSATERWDDGGQSRGFFAFGGNGTGAWVVAGETDHPDPALDAVLVLDGAKVIARESDPVDLDGNGLADDGVFLDTFGNEDLALSDGYVVHAVVTLKDAAGTRVGQALVRLDADPGIGARVCSGEPNSAGRSGRLFALGSGSVAANDLRLRALGLPSSSNVAFLVSRVSVNPVRPPGSVGTVCLGGTVQKFLGPNEFGPVDSTGARELAVDVGALPYGTGTVAGAPGETWYFQAWYRDSGVQGPTTNFTDAVGVTLE